jgi:hypothetical protein
MFSNPWSLDIVLFIQQWSPHPYLDTIVIGITLLGDPKMVFLYLLPLLVWCLPPRWRRTVGVEVLIGLLLADWINVLLKWPSRGDRPVSGEGRMAITEKGSTLTSADASLFAILAAVLA